MEKLRDFLLARGAHLVGFAGMDGVPGATLPRGVSVAVRLPKDVVDGIQEGPTLAYYDAYHSLNARLNEIVTAGAAYLQGLGYQAHAQTTTAVGSYVNYRTALPHKTVATRAGLGWIGRCALLVTPQYGSALRISSLLTDAPLPCTTPVTKSQCGDCHACVDACPGGAVQGPAWEEGMPRDTLFDPAACDKAARALCKQRIQKQQTLCGQCFVVCPFTKRGLAQPY